MGTNIPNDFKKVHLSLCLHILPLCHTADFNWNIYILLCVTGFWNGIKMFTSSQIATLMLLSISMFSVSIASPLFDNEEERILESFVEMTRGEEPLAKKIPPVEGNDRQLPKYIANEARENNGKFPLRDSPKKQVGDRRLKCVLYDPKSRKCLRHKMSFLWGRR